MQENMETTEAAAATPNLDPARVAAFEQKLLAQQNLPLALAGGFAAALAGAIIWAAVTVATKYQIGWMAVGLGFLVGWTVRVLGKGITKPFSIAGAALALLGCLLGNLFSVCGFLAAEQEAPVVRVCLQVLGKPAAAMELMKITFSPMDLLFYGIAVYEGYKFSIRTVTEEDLRALTRPS